MVVMVAVGKELAFTIRPVPKEWMVEILVNRQKADLEVLIARLTTRTEPKAAPWAGDSSRAMVKTPDTPIESAPAIVTLSGIS